MLVGFWLLPLVSVQDLEKNIDFWLRSCSEKKLTEPNFIYININIYNISDINHSLSPNLTVTVTPWAQVKPQLNWTKIDWFDTNFDRF